MALFVRPTGACLLIGAILGTASIGPHGSATATESLQPGDYIVDTESPTCPLGGPIFRITPAGQVSVIAQGGILRKPRGNAVQDDNTLIVADGLAGVLRVDLSTGNVTRVAHGPPWQPRDVAIDPQGNYIVVDWPEASAAFLRDANGQTPSPAAQGSAGRSRPGAGGPSAGSPGGGSLGGPPAGPPAVYRISPTGEVGLVAQGGLLVSPHGVARDAAGNVVVADVQSGVVRVTPTGDQVQVLAGGSGSPMGAAVDISVDLDGSYVVADGPRGALIRVSPQGEASVIHRGPPFSSRSPGSQYGGPRGVVVDSNGDYVLVDEESNSLLRTTRDGLVSTVYSGAPLCNPADVTIYKPLPVPPPVLPAPIESPLTETPGGE